MSIESDIKAIVDAATADLRRELAELRAKAEGNAANTNAPDAWIDDQALAEMLSVSRETIQQWRQRDEGPPYSKLGPRVVRYRVADVHAWCAASKRGA